MYQANPTEKRFHIFKLYESEGKAKELRGFAYLF